MAYHYDEDARNRDIIKKLLGIRVTPGHWNGNSTDEIQYSDFIECFNINADNYGSNRCAAEGCHSQATKKIGFPKTPVTKAIPSYVCFLHHERIPNTLRHSLKAPNANKLKKCVLNNCEHEINFAAPALSNIRLCIILQHHYFCRHEGHGYSKTKFESGNDFSFKGENYTIKVLHYNFLNEGLTPDWVVGQANIACTILCIAYLIGITQVKIANEDYKLFEDGGFIKIDKVARGVCDACGNQQSLAGVCLTPTCEKTGPSAKRQQRRVTPPSAAAAAAAAAAPIESDIIRGLEEAEEKCRACSIRLQKTINGNCCGYIWCGLFGIDVNDSHKFICPRCACIYYVPNGMAFKEHVLEYCPIPPRN